MIGNFLHLAVFDEGTLDTRWLAHGRSLKEHVTHAEQLIGTNGIKDDTALNLITYSKGNFCRNISLDKTGDNVGARTLSGEHQVNTDSTRFLSQAYDKPFDVATR